MFMWIAIHRELHEIRADAAMVEQSIPLPRRPIASDSHASPLAADKELDEIVTRCGNLAGKPVVALYGVETSTRATEAASSRPAAAGADQIRIEPPWVGSSSMSTTCRSAVASTRFAVSRVR
jgi:hypothetical protein